MPRFVLRLRLQRIYRRQPPHDGQADRRRRELRAGSQGAGSQGSVLEGSHADEAVDVPVFQYDQ